MHSKLEHASSGDCRDQRDGGGGGGGGRLGRAVAVVPLAVARLRLAGRRAADLAHGGANQLAVAYHLVSG